MGQLEAKAEAARALEEEVEERKRQVAASREALAALRRAQECYTFMCRVQAVENYTSEACFLVVVQLMSAHMSLRIS